MTFPDTIIRLVKIAKELDDRGMHDEADAIEVRLADFSYNPTSGAPTWQSPTDDPKNANDPDSDQNYWSPWVTQPTQQTPDNIQSNHADDQSGTSGQKPAQPLSAWEQYGLSQTGQSFDPSKPATSVLGQPQQPQQQSARQLPPEIKQWIPQIVNYAHSISEANGKDGWKTLQYSLSTLLNNVDLRDPKWNDLKAAVTKEANQQFAQLVQTDQNQSAAGKASQLQWNDSIQQGEQRDQKWQSSPILRFRAGKPTRGASSRALAVG